MRGFKEHDAPGFAERSDEHRDLRGRRSHGVSVVTDKYPQAPITGIRRRGIWFMA